MRTARKKENPALLSHEENEQVQHLIEQYHQVAQQLHASTNQTQVVDALTAINALPEAVQIALLKKLSKEEHSDAADVLTALHALSPLKEVRKEARRSLIRLEATKTYPQWTAPIIATPAVQINVANPPRFWKGLVTQAREQGEIQLTLYWEQGYDYSDVRLMSFLLDYWRDGIKDAHVEITSKNRANDRINEFRAQLGEVKLVDCTLAEGRRLIEEALSVNAWRNTTPHQDYRTHLPIINNLVLHADNPGEDRGQTFINSELEDEESIVYFLGAWSLGDYGLAYDLLASNSAIRDGLSRDEWIERHRTWANEAHPARMELGFVHQREASQSSLWLPSQVMSQRATSRKEVEVGWSLELLDTPLNGALNEMPMGTSINKDTGRHWFWTNFTVVREQNAWRIQQVTDEGARIQGLSIAELQKRIQEYEDIIQEKVKQRPEEHKFQEVMEELTWRLTQLLHYYDALIAHLPLDRQVCIDAYSRSITVGNPERTVVYLERLAQRFPEQRTDALRRLGSTLATLAHQYDTERMAQRRDFLLARAEETLREAIVNENSAINHALLAELLLSMYRNDEAEEEFRQALLLSPSHEDETAIEAGLGNIAMRRERLDDALNHYRRLAEIAPTYPGIWFNIGFAYRLQGNTNEAMAHYQRSIQMQPADTRAYGDLMALYLEQNDVQHAREIAEIGLERNPDSAHLHALFASLLYEIGEQREALRHLERAEAIDPDLEIVQSVRDHINRKKKK